MIYIDKCDESFLKITGDYGYLSKIDEYFSFKVKGAIYSPAYKSRAWDGKTHLFNVKTKELYIGLYSDLIDFLKNSNIEYTSSYSPQIDEIPVKSIMEYIDTLDLPYPLRDYQLYGVCKALRQQRGLFLSATSCHPAGTKVIMPDGNFKDVKDIKVGDKLLGTNNEIRNVLETHTGTSKIYRIKHSFASRTKKFEDFYINENHILSLVNIKTDEIVNISLKDYLEKNKAFKSTHRLYMNDYPVEFNNNHDLKIDPYFIGLYLGDGHSRSCSITTMDKPIYEYIYEYVDDNFKDLKITTSGSKSTKCKTYNIVKNKRSLPSNKLLNLLREEGISIGRKKTNVNCSTKHIPFKYKTSSVPSRLRLLAGLIDSDGWVQRNNYYGLELKSRRLIEDIVFVARSLGYTCSMASRVIRGATYYRCYITGNDLYKIPVKLKRKKIFKRTKPRCKTKDRYKFDVEYVKEDTHYGFRLDGNHLYFLENFIITHNSGKSLIQYVIARYLINKGHKVIIVVPKISLVEQMYGDFKEYGATHNMMHRVYSGKPGFTNKDIVITTYQSLKNVDERVLENIDVIMVDEAHGSTNKTLKTFLCRMNHVKYKLGFTGTLSGDRGDEKLIQGLYGEIVKVITSKELIERGYSPRLTIEPHILHHKKKTFTDYHEEVKYICEDPQRNLYIKNLCESLEGNTLVLFNFIESHGDIIFKELESIKNKTSYYVYGGTEIEDREKIRKLTEKDDGVIICASLGVFSTGINIKKLHNIVFTSSTKSKIIGLQSIGRGLRKHESKDKVVVYDLVDDFTGGEKGKGNYTLRHFKERLKYYLDEGFNVDLKHIEVEDV